MNSPREKWQRSISKIISTNESKDSVTAPITEEPYDGDQLNEMEVEAYFQRLKSRTSVKHLWPGKRFFDIVEGDQTPEISTDSDEELDLRMSNTIKNLRQIRLDSDEDEMRKDYIREGKFNESDNTDDAHSDTSDDSMHLMDNVHFAELEINDVDLSDSVEREEPKDFLPQLRSSKFEETSMSDSISLNSGHYQGRSELDAAEGSSRGHTSKSLDEEIEKTRSFFTNETEDDVDTTPSEMQSIQSSQPESSRTSKSRKTSRTRSNSSRSRSSKHSGHSKSSKPSLSLTSSRHFDSSISNEHSPTASDANYLSNESSTSRSRYTSDTYSGKTVSNPSKSASSKSKGHHPKHRSKRKEKKNHKQKDAGTQTKQLLSDNKTDEVINFRYDWQRKDPSSIAVHALDPVAIDVLTSYNPSVLAANDVMKFHMQLLQQHIQDSRRLYEAYAKESVSSNYKYTTVDDTKKYIERNRPTVITYEEALRKEIKE